MISIFDAIYTFITILFTPVILVLITLLIFLFVGFYCLSSGIVANPLLKNLQDYSPISNKQIKPNRAIILLGAGVDKYKSKIGTNILANSRILETLRIYTLAKKANINYKIIISGGDPKSYGQSEAEVYEKVLEQLGVPKKDIILENKSLNTYQNARYVSKIIKKLPYKEYILVTSGIHMKRSILYFEYFGVEVIPAISEKPVLMMWLPTSYNILLFDLSMHEYSSIFRFYLYDHFGLNNESFATFSKAGQ